LAQPESPFFGVFDGRGWHFKALHPAAGPDLIDPSNRIFDGIMVEIHPRFEQCPVRMNAMIDGLEKSAFQQQGQFACINGIGVVSVGTDEFVATRLGNDELVHVGTQRAVEPTGHGTFLDGHLFGGFDGVQHRPNRR